MAAPCVADDACPFELLEQDPVDGVHGPDVEGRQEPRERGLVWRSFVEAALPRPEVVLGEEVGVSASPVRLGGFLNFSLDSSSFPRSRIFG